MIPLHDRNPPRRFPVVTRLLLGINILVWLYVVSLARQPGALTAFYDRYAFDWNELVRGVQAGSFTLGTFAPLVTHMFVHGGWLHVGGNMLYLWIFGDNVEDAMGSGRFFVFYLACGIVAAIAQGMIIGGPMVGASGAIAGVLGAYLVLAPGARITTLVFLGFFITLVDLPAIIVIGMFVVVQVIDSVAQLRMPGHAATEQVAYFAHVFGFLAGMLLFPMLRERSTTRRARVGWS